MSEDRTARQRVVAFEQALNELRGSVVGRLNEIDSKMDAGASIKDIQEMRRLLHVEQTQRLEQFQSLEAYRKAQLQDNERMIERFNRVTTEPSEDRVARERMLQAEKVIQEMRNAFMRKLQEVASRLEMMEGSGKDIDELTRTLRTESAARAELSQTLDAYRVAHLRTSAELRADIDLASEKLSRLESSNLQEKSALAPLTLLTGNGMTATTGFTSIGIKEVDSSVVVEDRRDYGLIERSVLVETKEADIASTSGLLGTSAPEEPYATSLLGSSFGGIRTAGSVSVASDVAEVLADEKRLLGRGLRFAGSAVQRTSAVQ
jgi:hypothetical protein